MIRQTVRSAALLAAGLVLASGAWGQRLLQTTSTDVLVAAEYFGAAGGREIQASKFDVDSGTAGTQRPYVSLAVAATINDGTNDIPGTGTGIAIGNVADITFTLSGASFSQTVSPANLDRRTACAGASTPAPGLSVSVANGGAKGDSSVTFRAEITTGELAVGQAICFWVPDLQATLAPLDMMTPPTMGVGVTATILPGVTNAAPFPGAINGGVDANDDNNLDGLGPVSDRSIFKAAPALVTSMGTGGTAYVSIADRSKIAMGVADPSAADPAMAAMGVSLGSLTVMAASNVSDIMKLDGGGTVAVTDDTNAVTGVDSSLGGQIHLTVEGPFQSGDKVVVGSGTTVRQVTPDGGMASSALELKLIDPGMSIVYVPGGTGTLRPSKFEASAEYSFNNPDNNNDATIMDSPSTGEIKYAGINLHGYAYGVVKGGAMYEASIIRATCEGSGDGCVVFADCTDQDGMNYFGGPVSIAAGATAKVDNDQLAAALGGGWDKGRGRCDIYSTAPLAVQHMIRTASGLINNSAVVGRGLDEQTDGEHAGSLADICNSIGTDDVAGDDTTTPADMDSTVCQPMVAQ